MSGASGVIERVGNGEAALLDEILTHGSIRALYQPIVDLDSGTVIAWGGAGPRAARLGAGAPRQAFRRRRPPRTDGRARPPLPRGGD